MEFHDEHPSALSRNLKKGNVRIPLYKQVFQAISEDIKTRNLPPNTCYLSEARAMARFQVSRVTIRQAFDLLERDGFIYRVQGKGTFIAPHDTRPARTVAMLATCILRNGVDIILLRAIEEYFDEHDINLIICNAGHSFKRAERYIKRLVYSRIDGLIYMPVPSPDNYPKNAEFLRFAANNGVPCIQLDRYLPEFNETFFSVTPDNFNGALALTEHLINSGHQRIGFCGNLHATSAEERCAGFMRCMEAHRLPVPREYLAPVSSRDDYDDAARHYLRLDQPPTAVLCVSDDPACLFMNALMAHGISVPEDMAVTGFDDHATIVPPVPLTTVRVPLYEEGRIAASLIKDLLDGKAPLTPRPVRLPCEVIVRASSCVKNSRPAPAIHPNPL
jgi:GntR family transcriptional regulator, arabinose operon transcriptional repressor